MHQPGPRISIGGVGVQALGLVGGSFEPGWAGVQVYYVGKHGNDANAGRSYGTAVLTFGQAITLAAAQTPTSVNRFAIVCDDSGAYAENLAVPAWVRIWAPNATLAGAVTLASDAQCCVRYFLVTPGAVGVTKAGAGTAVFVAELVRLTGAAVGAINATAGSILLFCVKMLDVDTGFGVGDGSTNEGHTHVDIEDIYIRGNGGTGLASVTPGSIVGRVTHILESGAPTTTRAIWVASGSMVLDVGEIDTDTAYQVGAAGELRMLVGQITGLRTVATGGLDSVTTAGSVPGTSTSIGTGAGTTTILTTEVLLSAANQSVRCGIQIDLNQALASLEVEPGDLAFVVAWLNDGTQTIWDLTTGLSASGATPALTGFVAGVGWVATLNATHQIVLSIDQDAAINRRGHARYWVGERVAQVAP